MPDDTLSIKFNAKDEVSKAIDSLLGKLGGIGSAIVVANQAFQLLQQGITAVSKAFDATIGAAADSQEIMNRLANAINLTGTSYNLAKPEIDAFLKSMMDTTKYGDEEMAGALQEMITLTGDYQESLKGARLAADLAATGLFNLQSASNYIGMAISGNTERLGRYIPELRASAGLITDNMTASEKWAVVQDVLAKKVGGMAQGELNTFNGQLTQLKNAIGEIGETAGAPFLDFLTKTVSLLADAATGVNDFLNATIDMTPAYVKAQQEATNVLNEAFKEREAALQRYIEFESKIRHANFEDVRKELADEPGFYVNASEEFLKLQINTLQTMLAQAKDAAVEHYREAYTAKITADLEFTEADREAKREQLRIARELYDELLASGQFTAEQLKTLFADFESGLADLAKPVEELNVALHNTDNIIKNIEVHFRKVDRAVIDTTRDEGKQLIQTTALVAQTGVMVDLATSFADQIASAGYEMIMFGKSSLKIVDILKSIVAELAAAIIKATILRGLFSFLGIPVIGDFLNPIPVIGGIFGGGNLHQGGMIKAHGGLYASDERLILAQTGEAVINRRATSAIGGRQAIDYINSTGQLPTRAGASGNIIVINIGNFIGEETWVKNNLIPIIEKATDNGYGRLEVSGGSASVIY